MTLLIAGGLVAALCGCDGPAPAYLLSKSPPVDGGPVLTIPFDFYREFIFVTVNVNNKGPRSFLLDSGTSGHEISLRAARELGLPLGRLHEVSGDGVGEGKTEESSAKGVSITVGSAEIYSGKVTICDMSPIENWLGRRVDGILGAPLFEPYALQIDYAKRVVRIFDPRKYALTRKWDAVPIRIRGHEPYLSASIVKMDGNSVAATLLVDTGADAPLSLNEPFNLKNGFPETKTTKPTNSTGLGGISPETWGHVKQLRIGKSGFPSIPTFFSMATSGQQASDKYDGTVGNYLLVHFLVTFDYPHKQIILQGPFPVASH